MKQEVLKKESVELSVSDLDALKEMNESYGAAEDVVASDLSFPICSLQHPLGKKVMSGETKPGDIYHYGLKETLGTKTEPMFFIPIKIFRFWRVEDNKGNLISQRTWKPEDVIDFEYQKTRKDGKRDVELHVWYMLTKNDFEANSSMPCKFSFKRSSRTASSYISTQLNLLKANKVKAWDFYWQMTSKLTTNKDNTYYEPVVFIDNKHPVPVKNQISCFNWYKTMTADKYSEKIVKDVMSSDEEVVTEEVMNTTIKDINDPFTVF